MVSARVAGLIELLGPNVVLLPIPSRCKGPVFEGWSKVTAEEMTAPAYLAQLDTGNIGVLLGAASGRTVQHRR